MQLHPACHTAQWNSAQKISFRFFFVYLGLFVMPVQYFDSIPGLEYISRGWYYLIDLLVNFSNDHFFYVRKVLVPANGSGDTSRGWAQLWLNLSLATIGCIIWSIVDRNRKNYASLNYLLCLSVRYFICFTAFLYGIEKVFALQMVFPSVSQLATPLGDFLPMRFSWLFIGYSTPYQVFSGVMECIVGLMLLYRRTATLGTVLAFGVFTNVFALNLCYDIPVKIYAGHMVLAAAFLLVQEYKRITAFFLMNKDAAACSIYTISFPKKWVRISRVVVKCCFILLAVGGTLWQIRGYMQENNFKEKEIKSGMYDVMYRDSTARPDSARWADIIFDHNGRGSVKTSDTTFTAKYGRRYFIYNIDSAKKLLEFRKTYDDSLPLFSLRYTMQGIDTVHLFGKTNIDSITVDFIKSRHRFQLAEKQFHWLTERNR